MFTAHSRSSGFVEYFRDFPGEHGRHTRVTLMFDRPQVGIRNKPRFAGASVTVTKYWRPHERADVATNAPEEVRAVLGEIWGALESLGEPEPQYLVLRTCTLCGQQLDTFREGPNGPTCLEPLSCPRATR